MAGRRKRTIQEQIDFLKDRIKVNEAQLQADKAELVELENKLKLEKATHLLELIEKSGKTVEEVAELLSKKQD